MQHVIMRRRCHAIASTSVEAWRDYDRRMTADADLAAVGAVLAEPARAKVLLALGDGRALAAGVLASEAGVAPSTASHHLARLVDAGLVVGESRGRHRYFRLAGPEVGELIEAVARVAPPQPVTSLRQGTRAHAIRYARSCYDHLAGRLGVAVADALVESGVLTPQGAHRLEAIGMAPLAARPCRDWTEQRDHIAGPLGTALLGRFVELGWLVRDRSTRAVRLTEAGRSGLPDLGVELPSL
jgi:DNA-binding transcriptional ArsR family regulator